MKKRLLFLAAVTVLLTACGKGQKAPETNTDSAVATPTAVSASVKEVVSDKIVQEFKDDEFEFGPAELVCYMPKGFKESEYPGEYYYKTYPKDISSINHIIIESKDNITLKTQPEFKEMVKEEFRDAYGDDVDITITQFDKMMIDGRPALVVMYNYDFKKDHYEVLTYVIYNGTESNYVTFLQGPGADWMDKFIECGESLHFEER